MILRTLKLFFILLVLVCIGLVFLYPEKMISPGKLISAHSKLEKKCFSCHSVFRGAATDKCTSCHKVADIGILMTNKQPVVKKKKTVAFHQELQQQDCVACHTDHEGMKVYRTTDRFAHELLKPAGRSRCHQCHKKPADSLHRRLEDKCSQCHRTSGWKPASFDHRKYFLLDRDHNVKCATCHTGTGFKTYTCYGCHEHRPEKIKAEHLEEGIRNFKNCVRCHRNASEKDAKRRWRKTRGRDD